MDIKKLIEDVIYDLANNEPLSKIVAKLQVISKLLKNEQFQSWIEKEFINGYKTDDEIPDYRNVFTPYVEANFIQHQGFGNKLLYKNVEVPISNLGMTKYLEFSEIKIRETVFSIEQILSENEGNLHLNLNDYEKLQIQNKILTDCEISSIHKILPRHTFQEVINKTKAKLLDLFLELNETVFNNEINFNVMEKKKEISQIVNHTINTGIYISDNSSANIQNSNIIGGSQNNFSEDFKKNVLELTEKIERLAEDIEVDRDDIAFEISKIKLELQKEESPQLIKSAFNAIKGIASNVAANEISDVINQGFQNINF